ncbi:MAG: NAD(P)H-binding protein [Cyanobacteria bacterium]|nr:NAD(P)H-binding protein [Cyanobacteriota bacterium]
MIYVAGGTSFLGKKVVEKLLKNNKEIKCLFRNEEARNKLQDLQQKYGDRLILVSGNLYSADSLIYGLKGADAAVYLVRLEYIEFVKNFLDAARKCGLKRAVFISSTTALLPKEGDIKKTKLEAEDLIKRSGLNYTILRPSMIYGGAGDNNFYKMLNFIKKKGFFVIFGSGKNLIQPVYVDDVTDTILNVLDNPATHQKTYEICGREAIQFDEMLETVKRKLKRNFKVIKLPIGISKFAVNIYKKIIKNSDLNPEQIEGMRIDRTYSYSEAQKDFGFSPVSFEEGIEKEIKEIGF